MTVKPGLSGDYLDTLLSPLPLGNTPPAEPIDRVAPAAARPRATRAAKARQPSTSSGPIPGTTAVAAPEPAPQVRRRRRERVTFQLDPDVVDEARDAAVFLLTRGQPASLAGLVEAALKAELARLRQEYTEGKPFPDRPFALPPGRRLERPAP